MNIYSRQTALEQLSKFYKNSRTATSDLKPSILELYELLIRQREEALMDTIALTAAVGSFCMEADRIEYTEISPQMEEAFSLAYPGKEISSLVDYEPHELQGIVSAWKGKYFEVLVRDKLNAGEWVGELHLEPGQTAELAESAVQKGWDLRIISEDGAALGELQLKATESLSYVKAALEKYPDIDVITTGEVGAAEMADIINSGISNEELNNAIQAPIESLLDSGVMDTVSDLLPGLPFVIIAVGEGRKVIAGRKTFERALKDGLVGALEKSVILSAGGIVAWLDGGLLSIPASLLTKFAIDKTKHSNLILQKMDNEIAVLEKLRLEVRI